MRTLTDIKDVYGSRQEIFIGMNLCQSGSERKIRGEVGDIVEIIKTDPFYKVTEDENDEFLIIIAPNTFAYNRGKRPKTPLIFRKKAR